MTSPFLRFNTIANLSYRAQLCQHPCRGRISNPDTRGKAYVVYEDVFDAKAAVDDLSGHNVMGRYISVVFHRPPKAQAGVQEQLATKRETVAALRSELKK
jgi:hypothetical protein